jgi:hypothetical protein
MGGTVRQRLFERRPLRGEIVIGPPVPRRGNSPSPFPFPLPVRAGEAEGSQIAGLSTEKFDCTSFWLIMQETRAGERHAHRSEDLAAFMPPADRAR